MWPRIKILGRLTEAQRIARDERARLHRLARDISTALADRKANRAIYRSLQRSEAAHKGWATRRGEVA